MKILIVTDAWEPQVNGVVTTLQQVGVALVCSGHQVDYLTPLQFKTIPCPTYPEIRLSLNPWKIGKLIRESKADSVHIATEGTLGIAARIYCSMNKIPFTSSYHTKMPEYVNMRCRLIPKGLIYALLRWLHKPSKAVLVTTKSMKDELEQHGFKNLVVWSRGVDFGLFKIDHRKWNNYKEKVLLYVGRLSVEKNIDAFLQLDVPNTRKVVVGDGPERQRLEEQYPEVEFLGYKKGPDLARAYAQADVFVFPSLTDTFGIVMIEAAACGTPVAAFPVTGPIDFVVDGVNGYLDEDLAVAVQKCLTLRNYTCYSHTYENYSWRKCADILVNASRL